MVSGRARSHREPGWRTARTGRWSGVQLFLSCRDFLELFWGGKSCHRLGESGMQHAGARSCLELLGNAVLFSYFHKLCNRHHNRFEHIFISLKRNPVLLSIIPQCPLHPPPSPQHLATTSLRSVSADLPVLDISYKRNRTHNRWDLGAGFFRDVCKVYPQCSR